MAQSQPAGAYMTTPAGDLQYDEDLAESFTGPEHLRAYNGEEYYEEEEEYYYDDEMPEGDEVTTERGISTTSPEGMPMPQSATTTVVASTRC